MLCLWTLIIHHTLFSHLQWVRYAALLYQKHLLIYYFPIAMLSHMVRCTHGYIGYIGLTRWHTGLRYVSIATSKTMTR